jgi:hypothetical protein
VLLYVDLEIPLILLLDLVLLDLMHHGLHRLHDGLLPVCPLCPDPAVVPSECYHLLFQCIEQAVYHVIPRALQVNSSVSGGLCMHHLVEGLRDEVFSRFKEFQKLFLVHVFPQVGRELFIK